MSENKICKRLFVRGHVQGVGFRKRTLNISKNYPVQGYVQNLPTGEVLLVIQGEANSLEQFLKHLRQEMGALISGIKEETINLEDFQGFHIR